MENNELLFDQLIELSGEVLQDGMCHFFHCENNWTSDVLSELLEQNDEMYLEYINIMARMLVKDVSEGELIDYFDIEGTPEYWTEQHLKALENLLEEQGFKYNRYMENGECKGIEFEDWTDGGVDMIHLIDGRDYDMTEERWWIAEIEAIYENFDVDHEIDVHRQDPSYCNDFTVRDSLTDFEAWQKRLKALYDVA